MLEAAPEASEVAPLPPPTETSRPPKARGKRKPLPAELPRIEIRHELPEHERICACCDKPMVEIGLSASEQLDLIPMQVRILRHLRVRYACPSGEHAPISAPPPAQVLPKSNASNDLLAML
nr:IS66 family transposase zinc-finger binding domain-containing protein [Crenobacter caeni]